MSIDTFVSATKRSFPWRRFLLQWGLLHAVMQSVVAAVSSLITDPEPMWYVGPAVAWWTALVVAFSCEAVMITVERRVLESGLRMGAAAVKSMDVLGTYVENIHASQGPDGAIVVKVSAPTGDLEMDESLSVQWSRRC